MKLGSWLTADLSAQCKQIKKPKLKNKGFKILIGWHHHLILPTWLLDLSCRCNQRVLGCPGAPTRKIMCKRQVLDQHDITGTSVKQVRASVLGKRLVGWIWWSPYFTSVTTPWQNQILLLSWNPKSFPWNCHCQLSFPERRTTQSFSDLGFIHTYPE